MATKKTAKKPATKKAAAEKAMKAKATKAKATDGKLSQLDAAAQLLAKASEPMNCQELVQAMAAKGLWTSPSGKTPHATLHASLLKEIKLKGKDARFVKTERGKFTVDGWNVQPAASRPANWSSLGFVHFGRCVASSITNRT